MCGVDVNEVREEKTRLVAAGRGRWGERRNKVAREGNKMGRKGSEVGAWEMGAPALRIFNGSFCGSGLGRYQLGACNAYMQAMRKCQRGRSSRVHGVWRFTSFSDFNKSAVGKLVTGNEVCTSFLKLEATAEARQGRCSFLIVTAVVPWGRFGGRC